MLCRFKHTCVSGSACGTGIFGHGGRVVPMPMGRSVASVLGVGVVSVTSGGGTALFTLSVQRWERHS
eukprot:11157425-Ditylum_brightwellii.AAC.1